MYVLVNNIVSIEKHLSASVIQGDNRAIL